VSSQIAGQIWCEESSCDMFLLMSTIVLVVGSSIWLFSYYEMMTDSESYRNKVDNKVQCHCHYCHWKLLSNSWTSEVNGMEKDKILRKAGIGMLW